MAEEAVERGAEHAFLAPGDFVGQIAFAGSPQDVFLAQAAYFPVRMNPGQEIEDLLVEKRVTRLHRGVHGHAVALEAEQLPRQVNAAGPVQRTIERVPAPQTL